MTKYLINRILRGICSIIIVTGIIMFLIYSVMNRELIFATDTVFSHTSNNNKTIYMYQKWEEYGYLDYVNYTEWMQNLAEQGEITEEERSAAVSIGKKEEDDSEIAKEYIKQFKEYYESKGYTIERLDAVMLSPKKYADGGQQQLFAHSDKAIVGRLVKYFRKLVEVDSIDYAKEVEGKRGITFTLHDPVYGGNRFAPAVIGNGTYHKYLLYCNSKFPFIHQNIFTINLGKSYTVNQGVDVFTTMTQTQGSYILSDITFPTGKVEERADDLHTATYVKNSLELNPANAERFTDNYTNTLTKKSGHSKMGYSFICGIIASMLAYLIAVPIGIQMARHKDGAADKIGTAYIIFMLSVPSLAYIFILKAVGGVLGLPTTFDMDSTSKIYYVLPIISLSLGSIASIMRWLRRYMIDQMNSDYVKFARSGGLTENEIFRNHILKNAIIPIIQGIPGSVLFAMVGAVVTESVYVVPGAGNLLTRAISKYDNGVIVGVALFYATLTVVSLILGDILMSIVDPRISFTEKDR